MVVLPHALPGSHGCACVPLFCPPTSLPTPPPSPPPPVGAVPEHPPRGPAARTSRAGHLFHTWRWACLAAVPTPTYPAPSSHRGQKSCLHVCVFLCCLAYRITRYCLSKFHLYALMSVILVFIFSIVLKYTLFTMSCQFLQYSKVIQLHMIYSSPLWFITAYCHLVACIYSETLFIAYIK